MPPAGITVWPEDPAGRGSLSIAGTVLPPAARCRRYDDGASSGPGRDPWYYGRSVRNPSPQDPARFDSLYAGVVAKVFDRLPDATWVYPGHGGDTTLGAERPHLAEWRERGW